MHLFIVTSVIYTKHASVFSPETRLNQLIETIKSIRKHMNDKNITEYIITVLEGSPLSQQDILILSKHANYIFMFNITELPKSIGEAVMLKNYFDLDSFKSIQPVLETISKISGRYYLTDQFDFLKFDMNDSIIKKDIRNWFRPNAGIYDTRYYRFHASHVSHFNKKVGDVVNSLFQGEDPDIEHSFFSNQVFPEHTLFHPEELGIEGLLAPSGTIVKD